MGPTIRINFDEQESFVNLILIRDAGIFYISLSKTLVSNLEIIRQMKTLPNHQAIIVSLSSLVPSLLGKALCTFTLM